MSASQGHNIFEFGGFYLDTDQRLLLKADGERVPLTSRAFDMLAVMVAHPGDLLGTDTLMRAVWPGTIVEENNLQQIITALRRALGETPDDHRFIVTSRGQGYRFVAPVRRLEALPWDKASRRAAPSDAAGMRRRPALFGMIGMAAVVLLSVLGFGLWHAVGSGDADPSASSVTVTAVPSIAVLPFTDLSPDGDQAYFSHGIAEELLNQLSRLEGLRVAGRNSSFTFEGADTNLRTIGETLGVGHVLQGSVRKDGNRVRINAQLVDTADGYQLWSKTFERELGHIFTIQDEIARAVAGALSIVLDIDARNRLKGTGTRHFAAYDSYLAATNSLRGASGLQEAILHLNRAIELDPDYAAAWAGLSLAHGQLSWRVSGAEKNAVLKTFETAAKRAVALDPQLSDARAVLANYHVSRHEWLQAEREFNAVRALSPQFPNGYATLLARTGRTQSALAHINVTLDIDPLHTLFLVWRALIYTSLGFHEDALDDIARSETLGFQQNGVAWNRFIVLLNAGDGEEVKRQFETLVNLGTFETLFVPSVLKDFDSPERMLAHLRTIYADTSRHGADTRTQIGLLAAYFGDEEFALQVMSEETKESVLRMAFLWFPVFADMRRLPEFKTLARELNLVDYWRESGWHEACRPLGTDDFTCD